MFGLFTFYRRCFSAVLEGNESLDLVLINIVLVPILTRTRNDAPTFIRVLIKNRKTYDLRGLMFLHVDVSVLWCILHVEITNKQG